MSVSPFETTHIVWGYDCGYGGPFKPLALADFFQEAAGDHADELGIGMREMFAAGRTWMLARTDTRVEALPREGDRILIRTWPAGTERLFALRCLEMRSESGLLLAGAIYSYLIVDIATRRPMRPERLLDPDFRADLPAPFPDLSPGAGEPGPLAASPEPSFTIKASPRHIDHNGHVNNGHLIDWLCDAVPRSERASGELKRLKVDFMSEVLEGETLDVSWASACDGGGRGAFSFISREGKTMARAYTDWR